MKIGNVVPVLRLFDEHKAREFYVEFLEFKIDWEHRLDANAPLYMQISKGTCVIHLSEHHGGACPGSALRVHIEGLEEYQRQLSSKNYKYYRPSIEATPWGTREMIVKDPFGNSITFVEANEGATHG